MDFKAATDAAMELGVKIDEIATALGVSRASVTHARLPAASASKREPPDGWREALRGLCERRGGELEELAKRLQ